MAFWVELVQNMLKDHKESNLDNSDDLKWQTCQNALQKSIWNNNILRLSVRLGEEGFLKSGIYGNVFIWWINVFLQKLKGKLS